ncbi:MAG: hypothetical protein ACTHOK_03170 [Nocardioidaceae bacterium]
MTTDDDDRRARPPALAGLGRSVQEAREFVRECRHPPVVPAELAEARRALIAALTDYTVALEQRHLPVPHALRSELEMHRRLFDS